MVDASCRGLQPKATIARIILEAATSRFALCDCHWLPPSVVGLTLLASQFHLPSDEVSRRTQDTMLDHPCSRSHRLARARKSKIPLPPRRQGRILPLLLSPRRRLQPQLSSTKSRSANPK